MSVVGDAGRMAAIVRGGALTLGGSVIGRAASVAQSIVVARGLDPHRLGLFAIVNYVLALGAAVVDLGVPVAAMRAAAESRLARPGAVRRTLATLAVLGASLAAAGAVLLLAGAGWLADLYREPALAPLFRLAAALLFASLVGAFVSGVLQGVGRIDTLAALTPLKAIVALAATLALLPLLGLAGVIIASLVAEVLAWALAVRPLRQAVTAMPPDTPDDVAGRAVVGRALGVSVPVVLHGLVIWGGAWLLRSYLARAAGYEPVGYFHVADACARLLLLLPSAVAVPFVPAVSESSGAGREATAEMVERTLRLTLFAVAPAGVALCLAAAPVVELVYGAAYLPAAPLTSALVIAAGLQAIAVIVWSTLVGLGRTWIGLGVQAGAQAAAVLLSVVLLPSYGLAGVGGAAIVAAGAAMAVGLAILRTAVGVRLAAVRAPLIVALGGWVVAGALRGAGATGWLEAGAAAAFVVGLQLRALTPAERRWVAERLTGRLSEVGR